jgi:response regulator RpfG family c-di-GMP phosphodiesterase
MPLRWGRWACPSRAGTGSNGAPWHDVGTLGVSNTILDKPGKLDDAEWEAVRRHGSCTQTILGRISIFDPKFLSYPVAGMSGCEKFDGIRAG